MGKCLKLLGDWLSLSAGSHLEMQVCRLGLGTLIILKLKISSYAVPFLITFLSSLPQHTLLYLEGGDSPDISEAWFPSVIHIII
jgi:hypothetical protein